MNNNLAISADKYAGCAYHRIIMPLEYGDFAVSKPTFWFNRLPLGGIRELDMMRGLGFKIVADVDDYWVLPKTHYLYAHWTYAGFHWRIPEALQKADVVTCTTDYLAEKVRPYNRNVVVIPNALPFDRGQFTRDDSDEACGFVYVAGESHRRDLAMVARAVNSPDVRIAGFHPESSEWALMRKAAPRATFVRGRGLSSYMRLYDGSAVALAPLVSNTFNRCKSNLKVLEAGAKGLPIICSKTLPYYTRRNRIPAMFASTPHEWRRIMRFYRQHPHLVEYDGRELAEYVRKEYSLEKTNALRQQVFTSL